MMKKLISFLCLSFLLVSLSPSQTMRRIHGRDAVSKYFYCDTYAGFAEAITAIGATKATLIITSQENVTDDATAPATLALAFNKSGTLNISNTKTVTINNMKNPGLSQVFEGAGSVSFGTGAVKEVYPEWWGNNTTPGTTDMTAEIQAAFDTSETVLVSPTRYKVTSKLTAKINNQDIFMDGAILETDQDITIIEIGESGSGKQHEYINVRGINVYKTGSSTKAGIIINQLQYCSIDIKRSQGFHTALKLQADEEGCHYNSIYLGKLHATTYSLHLAISSDGWIQEITFYGGFFTGGAITYCVYSPDSGSTYGQPKQIKYISPGFEPTSAQYAVEDGGQSNAYFLPRHEGTWTTDSNPFHFNSDSSLCIVIGTWDDPVLTDDGTYSMRLGYKSGFPNQVAIGKTGADYWLELYKSLASVTTNENLLALHAVHANSTQAGFGAGIVFKVKSGSVINENAKITAEAKVANAGDASLNFYTRKGYNSSLTKRLAIDVSGIIQYTPIDNAATPVAPTSAVNFFGYNKSLADEASVTLPLVATNGYGVVLCDTDHANRTMFYITSTGTVTLLNNAGSVVANANTDTNLCIGTASPQEPLLIKNRLGSTKIINIMFWYN